MPVIINPTLMKMKKVFVPATVLLFFTGMAMAQKPAQVQTVINAEENFNKVVARKGIKDGFLSVADPDGIVFKPDAKKMTEFYGAIDKQPGTLSWKPNFARIAAKGDLAFTAGPYIYQNGKSDDDKVYGDYVSIWHADAEGNLKLLIDLGIQHPEPESTTPNDFREPLDTAGHGGQSKDPFGGKKMILSNDETLNHTFTISTIASYKEFLSPEAHYYFPGFDPIVGSDKIMKFIANEAISITAETANAGRSLSNDLAYTYGKARIKKGNVVSNYNYVRIWEIDSQHKWNILLEVFSSIEN